MMDLDFARRWHAKEVCQEVKAMDDLDLHMKPFMRLVHRTWRDTVWELLDDPRSSWCAWILSQIFKLLVVASIVTTTLQISEEAVVTDWKLVVQIVFDVIFFIECVLRIVTAPHKRSYFLDPLNWGDMLSALGLPVLAAVGFAQDMPDTRNEIRVHQFLLLFLPLARFLKLLRYFESFRLLVDAFAKSAEALPVLTYIMAFIVLLSGTSIYLAEDRENIPSMPHSLWLALVTMTTVGYGDYYPKTSQGYITVSVLTFVSVLFLALPVGIIGAEFNMTWQRRAEMLLRTRIRNALSKWGYAAADVETLFEYADADNDGQLELGEFIELVRQMRIGVSVETAAKLFHIMDANQDGHIDRIELLRSVYPDEYAKHTQSISSDEMFFKTKRRIGMALERLDSLRSSVSSKMTINSSTPEDDAPNFKAATPKNTGLKFLKVFPAGASRSSGRRSAESRSSKISQRSDRTEVTVVDQGSGPAKRATVNAPVRRTRAPRSMDLEIAWRLHAREIAQEDGETIKPLLRLVERRRADIVWELLDDPNSSRAAWYISQLLKAVVILSVLWTNLQIIEEPVVDLGWACAVETVIDSLFLVEFICRVLSAPSKRNYFLDPLNWADVLTALALPIRASIGFVIVSNASSGQNVAQHLLLFFVPVVRFLKLLRYFESFRLLIDACGKSAEALPVLVYMTCLIVLLAATAIYLAEDRGNIPSMPHSLWLALVTMTTVGYGDYYPTSLAGYLTVSVLTFVSVLFLALPVGIIGHEFTMSWQSRIQVLLMNR